MPNIDFQVVESSEGSSAFGSVTGNCLYTNENQTVSTAEDGTEVVISSSGGEVRVDDALLLDFIALLEKHAARL